LILSRLSLPLSLFDNRELGGLDAASAHELSQLFFFFLFLFANLTPYRCLHVIIGITWGHQWCRHGNLIPMGGFQPASIASSVVGAKRDIYRAHL
jgi:hypothetical protein